MPNPAAPASSAPVTAGAAVARAISGTDGKNSLNGIGCGPWRAGKLAKAIHALQIHGSWPGWNWLTVGCGSDQIGCFRRR